jgi:hypothetical protein
MRNVNLDPLSQKVKLVNIIYLYVSYTHFIVRDWKCKGKIFWLVNVLMGMLRYTVYSLLSTHSSISITKYFPRQWLYYQQIFIKTKQNSLNTVHTDTGYKFITQMSVWYVSIVGGHGRAKKAVATCWNTDMSEHTLRAFMHCSWNMLVSLHHIYALIGVNELNKSN